MIPAALLAAGLALAAPAPVAVVDDLGTTVVVASSQRIVSLSPGATEILYALGAGSRLVGRCAACDHPRAVKACPTVGEFVAPSLEAILAKRPDLIVTTGGAQRETVLALRRGTIPVLVLYPTGVEGLFRDIETLGEATRTVDHAMRLESGLRRRIAQLVARVPKTGPKPVVYFEIWNDPIMAIGDRSYTGELIRLAGGENVTFGLAGDYPRMSAEAVIAARPDVIFLAHSDDPGHAARLLATRPGWANVPAVRNGRVWADLDMDTLVRPGPRLADGLAALIDRLHPK